MNAHRIALFLILCIVVALVGCREEPIDINSVEDFESFVRSDMKDQHIPAVSVLLFRGSEVLYENYFGLANIEQNLALENDHMFLIASVSKVITAMALLRLYDRGAFALDDSINDYLPYAVVVPGASQEITFRMLLTHTSAIEDNYDVMDEHYFYDQDSPVSLSDFLENYLVSGGQYYHERNNFYSFVPGSRHEYSNIGSALIAGLVEQISGVDFNSYCKENIFAPLGMNHTSWRLDEITSTIVTPYDYTGGKNQAIRHYTNTDYPNGGLRTTVRDMFSFLSNIAHFDTSQAYVLLKESTFAAMISPQIPSIDSEVGLHMFVMNSKRNLWGHDGGEQGVATIFGFNPENQTGAIIFSNQGEAYLDDMLVYAYQLGVLL